MFSFFLYLADVFSCLLICNCGSVYIFHFPVAELHSLVSLHYICISVRLQFKLLIITVAIPQHCYLQLSNTFLFHILYSKTTQTNICCMSVCRSSQFVSHINIALTWVYFSNVISLGCLSNCISPVYME